MPSRKQRRRREKERRHEYEYVYVDDEGEEVTPAEEPQPRRQRDPAPRDKKQKSKGAAKGSGREYHPPSWKRSARRALLFFPLFFIVFSLVNKNSAIAGRLFASAGYSVLFIPLTYMMDRTAYRASLRRSGRLPDGKR